MRAFALAGLLLLAAIPVRAQGPWKSKAQARPVRQTGTAPSGGRAAFEDSWRFYKRRIEQGDSLAELENILLRIRSKYGGVRVNHAMVERELGAVQALMSLEQAAAVGGE